MMFREVTKIPTTNHENHKIFLLDRTRPAGGPHMGHLLLVSFTLPSNIISLTVGFKLNVI